MVHGQDHRSRGEEQQGLEEGVGSQVEDRRLIATATGGEILNICNANWANSIEDLALASLSAINDFTLDDNADGPSIEVYVDGVEWTTGWTYNGATNSVSFDDPQFEGGEIIERLGDLHVGRARNAGEALGRSLGRMRRIEAADDELEFSTELGFLHHFQLEEISELAASVGREARFGARPGFPHVTFAVEAE